MATSNETNALLDLELKFYNELKNKYLQVGRRNQFYEELNNAVRAGKREIYQKRIKEGQELDDTWVDKVESYIPYLDKIVRNPKYYMLAEEDVVRIEQARKINARSVVHLSTHTENVQDILDDGVIVPKKVLVTHYEDNLAIYENRFIMTLIAKLAAFIELRYEIVKEHQISYTSDRLNVNSNFSWRNYKVDFVVDMKITEEDTSKQARENAKLISRIEELRKFAKVFINSEFYKEIKKVANPVGVPLLKTNILLHNVDYGACVQLWEYLDGYRDLGVNVSVAEKNLEIDDEFLDDISNLVVYNYGSFLKNREVHDEHYRLKKYTFKDIRKPKEITRLENEYLALNAYGMEYPSVNQYFYELTLAKEKDDVKTEMVNKGVTFNQAVVTTYKRMQNISNAVYKDILKEYQPEELPEEATYQEKRKAKYQVLKKKAGVIARIADLKQADAEQARVELSKIEQALEKYKSIEKEIEKELKAASKEIAKDEKEARAKFPMSLGQYLYEEELENQRRGDLALVKDVSDELDRRLKELQIRLDKEKEAFVKEQIAKMKEESNKKLKEEAEAIKKEIDDYFKDKVLYSVPKHVDRELVLSIPKNSSKFDGEVSELTDEDRLLHSYDKKPEVEEKVEEPIKKEVKENKKEIVFETPIFSSVTTPVFTKTPTSDNNRTQTPIFSRTTTSEFTKTPSLDVEEKEKEPVKNVKPVVKSDDVVTPLYSKVDGNNEQPVTYSKGLTNFNDEFEEKIRREIEEIRRFKKKRKK